MASFQDEVAMFSGSNKIAARFSIWGVFTMRTFGRTISTGFVVALSMTAAATPLYADDDDTAEPTTTLSPEEQKIQDKLDSKTREKELLEARNALLAERIKMLEVDGFSASSALDGDNAGALEINFLGMGVVHAAADQLTTELNQRLGSLERKSMLILTGDEKAPWGNALQAEPRIELRTKKLEEAIAAFDKDMMEKSAFIGTVGTAVAIANFIGDLTSSSVTVSNIPLSISDQLVLRALLARNDAFKRHDAYVEVDEEFPLIEKFATMQEAIQRAKLIPEPTAPPEKVDFAKLKVQIALAEALETRLLTAGESGELPLYTAARYQTLFKDNPLVARIDVQYSGGTAYSEENFGTKFRRRDPVGIAAGVVLTYDIFDPMSERTVEWGAIRCRSNYVGLRQFVNARPIGETPEGSPKCMGTLEVAKPVTPKTTEDTKTGAEDTSTGS